MSRDYVQPSTCLRVPSSVSLHRCIAWSACASTSIAPFPGNFQKTPDSTRRESAAPWNLCIGAEESRPVEEECVGRRESGGGATSSSCQPEPLCSALLFSSVLFSSLYTLQCAIHCEQKTLRRERREGRAPSSSRRDVGRCGEMWGDVGRRTPSSSCRRPPPPTQSRSRAISRDLG